MYLGVLLCGLAGVGFGVYVLVLKPDPSVLSGEEQGLEAIRPKNMRIVEISPYDFVVEWEVSTPVTGHVAYGDTSTSINLIAHDASNREPATRHRVRVSGLMPGKRYFFWVVSDDITFGRNGKALEVLTLNE